MSQHPSQSISHQDLVILLGLFFAIVLSSFAGFGAECDLLRGHTVRLHILANSDDPADQALKLQVRDRILQETGEAFSRPQTQQEALDTARAQLPAIQNAAQEVLMEQGVKEPVQVRLERCYFTTRQYGNLLLPAGIYDAVQVSIGEGAGKNWWCVMYPPLCVSTALAEETPAFQEIQELNQQPLFKPKLAIVELLEGLFHGDE